MPITINDDGDRFSIGDTFWTDNAFVPPFDLPAGSYHLGIRPEKLVPVSIANPDTITAKVKSLQQLGNDTLIFCDFDGQTLVSRVPEQFTIAVGADLNLLLPANADEWHLLTATMGCESPLLCQHGRRLNMELNKELNKTATESKSKLAATIKENNKPAFGF